MAKKEYLEMLKYGEWLKEYLENNIKGWRFRELFEDAVKILELETKVGQVVVQNDVFMHLESIEENEVENDFDLSTYYKKLVKDDQNIKIDHSDHHSLGFLASLDDDALEEVLESEGQYHKDEATYEKIKSEIAQTREDLDRKQKLKHLIDFLSTRQKVLNLSRELIKSNKPWEYIFNSNLTNEDYHINSLLKAYNELVEQYYLENNKFIKTTKLVSIGPRFPSIPAWMTIIARIFIGFLVLGGQEYLGFCEYCDKFFVVQRKGRKKYCSDSCRALASKDRISG